MTHKLVFSVVLGLVPISVANGFQTIDDADLFKERESDSYIQKGIKLGSFDILPKFDQNNEYNTNIYKRDKIKGEVGSYIAHFKPSVDIKSNWNRHALNFKFNSDLTEYANQADQNNYQDIFTHLAGKLDVLRDSHLDSSFIYNSLHEDRGSPDQIAGKGPTFYEIRQGRVFYAHKFNRFSLEGGLESTRYDYQDVMTSTDQVLAMSSRNHWEHMPSIRVGYEIQPEYEAFTKIIYKQADYDTLVKPSGSGDGVNRNSTGYNALGGLAFDLTDLITGDFSIGYLQRNYIDASFQSISGINGFFNLKWRPTALTTVMGRIGRDINETTQKNVAGILATTASLNIEHELFRNVLLKAGGSIANNEYQGHSQADAKNRNEQVFGGNVSAKYLLNRNFSTGLSYIYQSRDVNLLASNYEVQQIMLDLQVKF